SKAQEANILPPALIVIGDVVTLSDRLSFIPEAFKLPENLYCDSLA
ncbi:uroporphyrin-III C-methyltransferase, partial [Citrobacter freundii]